MNVLYAFLSSTIFCLFGKLQLYSIFYINVRRYSLAFSTLIAQFLCIQFILSKVPVSNFHYIYNQSVNVNLKKKKCFVNYIFLLIGISSDIENQNK